MSDVKFSSRNVESAVKTLYLDEETADVHFVLDSNGQSERVPAHKTLLIAASKVFRAMFNGQWKEKDVVPIPDVLVADFKAFLQYFYLSEVKLSTENVDGVMSLSHQYDIEAGFNDCASILEHNLSVDNVCSTYKIALFYDHEQLKSECEIFISLNTEDVLKSSGFLECDRETLSHILRLEKMNCTETNVFNACMEWVKSTSKQDDITKELVVNHLGNVFYDIRFGSMKMEEFDAIYKIHEFLFTTDEQSDIKKLIKSKKKLLKSFNGTARVNPWGKEDELEWHEIKTDIDTKRLEFSIFSTDKTALLNAIVCSDPRYSDSVLTWKLVVREIDPFDDEKQPRELYQTHLDRYGDCCKDDDDKDSNDEGVVRFPKPLVIKRGFKYEIRRSIGECRARKSSPANAPRRKMIFGSGFTLKFDKRTISNGEEVKLIEQLRFAKE